MGWKIVRRLNDVKLRKIWWRMTIPVVWLNLEMKMIKDKDK